MKVALVHDFFNTWGGGERVLKVFGEMFPEAPIYLINYRPELMAEFMPGRDIRPSFLQKFPGMPGSFKYYLSLMPRAVESFKLDGYDLVLSDCSSFCKGAITPAPTRHVCYLHTPTRYLWSDYENYVKSAPIPLPILGQPVVRTMLNSLRSWDYRAAQRPNVLIANSRYIAQRSRTYYRRNPDYVVFPPVEGDKFKIGSKVGDYWLVVARAEPYKRTDLAILAANQLGLKLKVVGGGSRSPELQKLAGPTVEFLGRVSETELAEAFAGAIGFIFPPAEDAGITPLEAMASGRPVVAYSQGGALESVKAGVTGEFFADQTVESLVGALREFRPEKYDPATIRAHAMQFDKEVFKQKIDGIIAEALKSQTR